MNIEGIYLYNENQLTVITSFITTDGDLKLECFGFSYVELNFAYPFMIQTVFATN